METRAGNAKKDCQPRAIEWGRLRNRARGLCFLGPRRPHNELYSCQVEITPAVLTALTELATVTNEQFNWLPET